MTVLGAAKLDQNCRKVEIREYKATSVVCICSSLLQLAPESRDLSQAEKRITDV